MEKLNQKLFIMYGVKTLEIDAFSKYYYVTDEFSDCFFRVTGYENDATKDKIIISRRNGLLSLKPIKNIYDIGTDLKKLLNKNYDLIKSLKLYRNKAQHVPHTIGFKSLGSTNDEFDISFEYESNRKVEKHKIDSQNLREMVIDLNSIIIKLLEEVWNHLSIDLKTTINSKSNIESLFMSKKYLKFNELLLDKEKRFFIDLMEYH